MLLLLLGLSFEPLGSAKPAAAAVAAVGG